MTKQLPGSYLLLPKRYKETKIIQIIFNIQFCSDRAVTRQLPAVNQKDIRKQKSSKLYSRSNFKATKQLPGSYLLLPKKYKETKSLKSYSTSNFAVAKQLPGSYQLLPKRYKETKIILIIFNIQFCSDQAVTRQLPKRYKETKIIHIIFNIQFCSDQAVTRQLPAVTKEK